MKRNTMKRPGLILLVVLGMLALFSLLAITYVLFSGHSRSVSVSLSRSEIRGNKSARPLYDEAIMQLIRGTRDPRSSLYGQDVLADVYGYHETLQQQLMAVRDYRFLPNGAIAPLSYNASLQDSWQRPMILGGHFLRIPLDPGPNYMMPTLLPPENDALTGSIVTFPPGEGPLGGNSFRVVRYIGQLPLPADNSNEELIRFAQSYSITIDLADIDLGQIYTQIDPLTLNTRSMTVGEWASLQADNIATTEGVYLCYRSVQGNGLSDGYRLFFNATPLNTHGYGVFNDGSSQMHNVGTAALSMPVGLQTRIQDFAGLQSNSEGTLVGGPTVHGDSDEPYDAADANNTFLAHRRGGATHSEHIIPSFHRAALINYIVNWKDPRDFTEAEFLDTLRRIQLAMGRPLSINIRTPSGPPASYYLHRNAPFNAADSSFSHPSFTGSNVGGVLQTPNGPQSSVTQLSFDIGGNWSTDWPTIGYPQFERWLNFLTAGPWDVDNDGDGIMDSVWIDIGMPLQTSADGKLLKALVAYYVEDLDGKLDVNATGNIAQANYADVPYAQPTTNHSITGAGMFVPQGVGYGPAEISFRHLLAKGTLSWSGFNPETAYRAAMISRYRRNPTENAEISPGGSGDDPLSILRMREHPLFFQTPQNRWQRAEFSHTALPGLPVSVTGRTAHTLDRVGNVYLSTPDVLQQGLIRYESPYESSLVTAPHHDSRFTLAEWERIYRIADSDSSALPTRLQERFGESNQTLASSTLRHEITPISRHLRVPKLTTRSQANNEASPTSFYGLVNSIRRLKDGTAVNIPYLQFTQLFPLEFSRGLPLNLNRPLGNGVDDSAPGTPGFGEIDDAWELANIPQRSLYVNSAKDVVANVNEDYLGSVAPGGRWEVQDPVTSNELAIPPQYSGNQTRQLFARHIYCLAQLIVPEDYAFPNVDRNYYNSLSSVEQMAIRARTLAQWAVNVVDFRDSDATMTRFPYDSNPFDNNFEWNPDRVVWGLEQPELLLTETLAFHDLRVRNQSTTGFELEQYRIPQGSLFLEFFCPRSTSTTNSNQLPGVSPSLYTSNAGNEVVLDLSKLTPDGNYPVWRAYITGPVSRDPTTSPVFKTPDERLRADAPMDLPAAERVTRNDLTYQLPSSNVLNMTDLNRAIATSGLRFDYTDPATDQALQDVDIDIADARVVVFANLGDAQKDLTPGVEDAGQVYVNRTAGPLQLHGNQYLVVGPRELTYLGSRVEATANPNNLINAPNFHRIELDTSNGNNWLDVFKATDTNYDPTDATDGTRRTTMRQYVTMIAEAEASWTDVGINVSERHAQAYYPEPDISANPANTQADPLTGELGFADLPNDSYGSSPSPFDDDAGVFRFWDFPTNPANDSTGDGNVDLVTDDLGNSVVRPGTMLDWSTVYLQRLADPNKAWDAVFNPYITVDWIPIDLTVFSGEENDSELDAPTVGEGGRMALGARQKAGQPADATTLVFDTAADGIRGQTFYSALTAPPAFSVEPTPPAASNPMLRFELPIDERWDRPTPVDGGGPGTRTSFSTLGFLNSTFNLAAESVPAIAGLPPLPPEYIGSPGDPGDPANLGGPRVATWRPDTLFWTNREFINALEIAYVPVSSPGQLMHEFSATSAGTDFYGETTNAYPYAHLMNFFQAVPELAPNVRNTSLAMLMDLMETPSPWNDAYKLEPPTTFASVAPSNAILASQNAIFSTLRAPYNTIARGVEPGRVNLNTIPEASPVLPAGSDLDSGRLVFKGLWSNLLQPNVDLYQPSERNSLLDTITPDAWLLLQQSRRGYAPANNGFYNPPTSALMFNSRYPTQFAGVFRPITEAGMVPSTRNNVLDENSRQNPVNVTLMRGRPVNGAPHQFMPEVPLFSDPLNFEPGAPKHAFADLNPITRLSKLTTDRSNVFAVYVTIGLFEYDPDTQSIGMEYGADSGTNDRAKAFYVIDRSVPVGYRVGEDQNADKTILLRRNLEN